MILLLLVTIWAVWVIYCVISAIARAVTRHGEERWLRPERWQT